jgi:hypothetical protein
MVLFVMLNYQGRTLQGIEKVFPPQQPLTQDQVAERHKRLEQEYAGALFDPKDGADFVQTAGYYRLLQSLYQTAATSTKPPKFDRELAMRDPDAQRGQRVLLRGHSGEEGMDWVRLVKPLLIPGGQLTDVLRVVLTDPERDDSVIVHVLEDPGKVTPDDLFECEAMFWRIVKFGVQNRPDLVREAPFLLARSIRPVPNAGERVHGMSRASVVLVLAAMLGILLFGVYRIIHTQRRPNLRAEIRRASLKPPPDAPSRGAGPNP